MWPPQKGASMVTFVHDTTSTFPEWDQHAEDVQEAKMSDKYTHMQ